MLNFVKHFSVTVKTITWFFYHFQAPPTHWFCFICWYFERIFRSLILRSTAPFYFLVIALSGFYCQKLYWVCKAESLHSSILWKFVKIGILSHSETSVTHMLCYLRFPTNIRSIFHFPHFFPFIIWIFSCKLFLSSLKLSSLKVIWWLISNTTFFLLFGHPKFPFFSAEIPHMFTHGCYFFHINIFNMFVMLTLKNSCLPVSISGFSPVIHL